jgi:hypothetical protein
VYLACTPSLQSPAGLDAEPISRGNTVTANMLKPNDVNVTATRFRQEGPSLDSNPLFRPRTRAASRDPELVSDADQVKTGPADGELWSSRPSRYGRHADGDFYPLRIPDSGITDSHGRGNLNPGRAGRMRVREKRGIAVFQSAAELLVIGNAALTTRTKRKSSSRCASCSTLRPRARFVSFPNTALDSRPTNQIRKTP